MGGACDRTAGQSTLFIPVYWEQRIFTRCPACHNDTLTINDGRLLCTWHECPDPTMIDRIGEPLPNAPAEAPASAGRLGPVVGQGDPR